MNTPNPQVSGAFGRSIAGVPDVNNDGVDDIAVGAPQEDVSPSGSAGRVYLFDGATGTLRATLVSPLPDSLGFFGWDVAGIPDVTGDGRGDVIVGARQEGTGGKAYIYSGAAIGAVGTPVATLTSPNMESVGDFGNSVAAVPDANNDGKFDVLVGAPHEDPGAAPTDAGRAYLFSGATVGASSAPLATLVSPAQEAGGQFGADVAGSSDLNVDGRGDLIVGAPSESPAAPGDEHGRVHVYSGATTGTNSAPIATFASPGPTVDGRLGWSVCGVPDTNGDARPDVVAAAIGDVLNRGRVYIYSGATVGASSTPLQTLAATGVNAVGFGHSVTGAADVNGDGRGDVLAGCLNDETGGNPFASGVAYAYSGATGALLATLASANPQTGGAFGIAVSFTSLPQPEWLVGASAETVAGSAGAGRAYSTADAAPAEYRINEIRIDHPSGSAGDVDEYFEIHGPPGVISGLTYVVIGDGSSKLINGVRVDDSGVIQEAVSLDGLTKGSTPALVAEDPLIGPSENYDTSLEVPLNFENNENVTHLLVSGFTGAVGDDLDYDDDGTLDVTPWAIVEDCVAIIGPQPPETFGERVYCATRVGPKAGINRNFAPGHVYRSIDGGGTWQIGEFEIGLASNDTPAASNVQTVGACCTGSGCTLAASKAACESGGGTWFGAGSTCSPNPCVGSCCLPGGCQLVTEIDCVNGGGFFRGKGTTCATAPCLNLAALGLSGLVINEIVAGDPGIDTRAFVELHLPFQVIARQDAAANPGAAVDQLWHRLPAGDSRRQTAGDATDAGRVDIGNSKSHRLEAGATTVAEAGATTIAGADAPQTAAGPPSHTLAGLSLIVLDGDTAGDSSSRNYKRVTYRYDFQLSDVISEGGFFVIGSTPGANRGENPTFLQNHSQTYAIVRTQDLAVCSNPADPTTPPEGCQFDVDLHRLTDGSVTAIADHLIDAVATLDVHAGDHAYFGAPVVKSGIFQATQMQRLSDGQDSNQPADWDVQWDADAGAPGDATSPGQPNVVETGACCTTSGCQPAVTRYQCENALGGRYQGNGSSCTPTSCVGACCVAGVCQANLSPAACATAGGAYMGDGVACGTVNCAGINVGPARNLGPGRSVILDNVVVTSIADLHDHPDRKAFQVRSGANHLSVVGRDSEIDPLLAGVATGDTIDLAGTTAQFNGHFELTGDIAPLKRVQYQDTSAGVSSVTTPAVDLQDGSATAESLESRISVLECVQFRDGGSGNTFEAGRSYLVTDGLYDVPVRVRAGSDLVGQTIPGAVRRVRGVVWQADFEAPTDLPPNNQGYRLVLRDASDILSPICGSTTVPCCIPADGCTCALTTAALCAAVGGVQIGNPGDPCVDANCQSQRLAGDLTQDNAVNMDDVPAFVNAVLGRPLRSTHPAIADMDCSGSADAADILPFVNAVVP